MMNKKAQVIDTEILTSPMFILLCIGSIAATMIGYMASMKMGMTIMPLLNLGLVIIVEIVASYFFAWRAA